MMKIMNLLCLVFIVLVLGGCIEAKKEKGSEEVIDGQKKGDQIIQALNEYYKDFDEYPVSLDKLVPSYIDGIPRTSAGSSYSYELSKNDVYYLSFPVISNRNIGTGTICTFIKRLDIWDCSQSFE